jgi:F-type H+-transporting ATPase subunit b
MRALRSSLRRSRANVDAGLAAALALAAPALAWAGDFTFQIHGYYIIDFLVFVAILVYFGRKPIAAMLDSRYKQVVADIEEARALRESAQARFDEYKARLEHLEDELAAMLTDVRKGTRTEVTRILADARATSERIAAEESARLTQEAKRIRENLAAHAASLALQLAEEELKRSLTPDLQQQLVARTLDELEQSGALSATEA